MTPHNQAMFTADPARHVHHWVRYGGKDAANEGETASGTSWGSMGGQIAVSFGATGITVTNNSGGTWQAGADRAANARAFDFGFDHRTVPMVSRSSFDPANGLVNSCNCITLRWVRGPIRTPPNGRACRVTSWATCAARTPRAAASNRWRPKTGGALASPRRRPSSCQELSCSRETDEIFSSRS